MLVTLSRWPCLFLVLLGTNWARAEGNCPVGYYPIGASQGQSGPQGCAPIPGYVKQNQRQSQMRPPPEWESRWGAIATDVTDTKNSSSGASLEQFSQESAEQAAILNCQQNGGINCKIEIVYGNGCVAMAGGNTGHNEKAGDTIDDAARKAMRVCKDADKNCKIYYTSCSLPVKIR